MFIPPVAEGKWRTVSKLLDIQADHETKYAVLLVLRELLLSAYLRNRRYAAANVHFTVPRRKQR